MRGQVRCRVAHELPALDAGERSRPHTWKKVSSAVDRLRQLYVLCPDLAMSGLEIVKRFPDQAKLADLLFNWTLSVHIADSSSLCNSYSSRCTFQCELLSEATVLNSFWINSKQSFKRTRDW